MVTPNNSEDVAGYSWDMQNQLPTRKQVKKAGSRIRAYHRGDLPHHDYELALRVVEQYRACFSSPTVNVNNWLRRYARDVGLPVKVSQRLKKVPTIIEKLTARETTLNLLTMHDIGGCRVVLDDLESLRLFEASIKDRRQSQILRVLDYVEIPRISGYRAVHIVLKTQPSGLPVEVQLRTQSMHEWAETSEGFSKDLGRNFKQDGDHPVQEFLAVVADIYFLTDMKKPIPHDLQKRYSETLSEARRSMHVLRAAQGVKQELPLDERI